MIRSIVSLTRELAATAMAGYAIALSVSRALADVLPRPLLTRNNLLV
jgi:hypothetical protein